MRTKRLFPGVYGFLLVLITQNLVQQKLFRLFSLIQSKKTKIQKADTRGLTLNGWGRTTTNPDMTLMCRSHHNQIILKIISVFFCTLQTLQLGSYLSYRIAFALNDWVSDDGMGLHPLYPCEIVPLIYRAVFIVASMCMYIVHQAESEWRCSTCDHLLF